MNDNENYIHKYYAPFLLSKNHEDLYFVSEYDSAKQIIFPQKNVNSL